MQSSARLPPVLRSSPMLRLRPVLPLLLCLGCADLLGLEGLSYESPTDEPAPSEIPSKEPDSSLGGNPGITVYEEKDFPLTLEAGTVIFADPRSSGSSTYFFYNPEEKSLTTNRLDLKAPDEIGHQSWPSEAPFSVLAHFPGTPDQIWGYQPKSGDLSRITGADGKGPLESIENEVGSTGRTHFLPFKWKGEWLGLVYDASNGHYRRFNPHNTEAPVESGVWDKDFTSLNEFSYEGNRGVLRHARESGVLAFDRFIDSGSLSPIFSVIWGADVTHVRTFRNQGEWFILTYDAVSGRTRVGSLTEMDGLVGFTVHEETLFREGLTSLTVVYAEGNPMLITYSDASERAALRGLSPLDDPGAPIIVR